ncbi:TonB-dependent receptor [Tenuifilum sp.]|uniref:TonB-dependent receptor n=1 Tax=Tenuifilum sp. TaxID=2760880 RepID=UPI002588E878|nr:TonB-dependent receptor [Tenuifilum sp.]
MKLFFLILATMFALQGTCQIIVTGKVTDRQGNPLQGANVIIKGTYNGVSTDSVGRFRISVNDQTDILVATFIGYKSQEKEVGETRIVDFKLRESSNSIGGVVITAGTYETSDRKRSVTLQPLDIVTTPSATGDIYGALTTLPGSVTKPEDGRLFVRGGDGYESKTFIDGLLVKKPYTSNIPDLGSRGRFSPQLFSGTMFSTGGYSAEYGQALSSALILNTNAFPQHDKTDISLMTVGAGVTKTLTKKKFGIAAGVEYFNLEPYMSLRENRFRMTKYPEIISGIFMSQAHLGAESIVKVLGHFSSSSVGVEYPDFETVNSLVDIRLKNSNGYVNSTFSSNLNNGFMLKGGVAFTTDDNKIDFQDYYVYEKNRNIQGKVVLKKKIFDYLNVLAGVEETYNYFNQNYHENISGFSNLSNFEDYNTSAFVESEFRPISKLAFRIGLRAENSSLLKNSSIAPRFSAAYKLGKQSQVSLAYGQFYQTPEEYLLRFTHRLLPEQANHIILNYQWENDDRIFRIEAYRKDYSNLVTYNSQNFWDGSLYKNDGDGFSKGVDIFWRDKKTFRMLEYWIAYSYIDSKRIYRDYQTKVTPPFAPKHTASIVAKYWEQSITTLFGLSATYSSGRPYNNPNSTQFMDGLTPYFADLSFNISHLRQIFNKQFIFYFAINNVTGRDNIFGYRYFSQPNSSGEYEPFPIKANNPRFIMAAIFVTL